MKINRMLIAVLAMLAVVLSSCKDDDPTVGIDSGMPAPSVFYDAANSAGKTIAVYWNPMQAISAGATSFTVQLVKSEDGAGDVYDNTISQTLASVDKDNQPADKAKFENLAKGRIYYVRVRANYPRSVYSPWILAASSEEDSTTARIKVGEGLVGPEVGESSDIETRFIGSTESSVSIAWSTCDTWTANDLDKSLPYRLELFADDKCTDLVVAWNAPANLPDGTSTKNAVFKLGTRFSFSNLNPETSYWARVTNTADNVVSEPVECKTGKSNYKAMPAAATVDEIILSRTSTSSFTAVILSTQQPVSRPRRRAAANSSGRSGVTIRQKIPRRVSFSAPAIAKSVCSIRSRVLSPPPPHCRIGAGCMRIRARRAKKTVQSAHVRVCSRWVPAAIAVAS